MPRWSKLSKVTKNRGQNKKLKKMEFVLGSEELAPLDYRQLTGPSELVVKLMVEIPTRYANKFSLKDGKWHREN